MLLLRGYLTTFGVLPKQPATGCWLHHGAASRARWAIYFAVYRRGRRCQSVTGRRDGELRKRCKQQKESLEMICWFER